MDLPYDSEDEGAGAGYNFDGDYEYSDDSGHYDNHEVTSPVAPKPYVPYSRGVSAEGSTGSFDSDRLQAAQDVADRVKRERMSFEARINELKAKYLQEDFSSTPAKTQPESTLRKVGASASPSALERVEKALNKYEKTVDSVTQNEDSGSLAAIASTYATTSTPMKRMGPSSTQTSLYQEREVSESHSRIKRELEEMSQEQLRDREKREKYSPELKAASSARLQQGGGYSRYVPEDSPSIAPTDNASDGDVFEVHHEPAGRSGSTSRVSPARPPLHRKTSPEIPPTRAPEHLSSRFSLESNRGISPTTEGLKERYEVLKKSNHDMIQKHAQVVEDMKNYYESELASLRAMHEERAAEEAVTKMDLSNLKIKKGQEVEDLLRTLEEVRDQSRADKNQYEEELRKQDNMIRQRDDEIIATRKVSDETAINLARLEDQYNALNKAYQDLQDAKSGCEATIGKLEMRTEAVESEKKEESSKLRKKEEEIRQLSNALDHQTSEVNRTREQHHKLMEQNNDLQYKLAGLESDLKENRTTIEKNMNINRNLENENENLRRETKALQTAKVGLEREVQSLNERLQQMKGECSQLQKHFDHNTNTIESLKKENASVKLHSAQSDKKCKDLTQQVMGLERQINGLHSQLSKQGSSVDRRTRRGTPDPSSLPAAGGSPVAAGGSPHRDSSPAAPYRAHGSKAKGLESSFDLFTGEPLPPPGQRPKPSPTAHFWDEPVPAKSPFNTTPAGKPSNRYASPQKSPWAQDPPPVAAAVMPALEPATALESIRKAEEAAYQAENERKILEQQKQLELLQQQQQQLMQMQQMQQHQQQQAMKPLHEDMEKIAKMMEYLGSSQGSTGHPMHASAPVSHAPQDVPIREAYTLPEQRKTSPVKQPVSFAHPTARSGESLQQIQAAANYERLDNALRMSGQGVPWATHAEQSSESTHADTVAKEREPVPYATEESAMEYMATVGQLENRLMNLAMERQQLEGELAKMPVNAGRTIAVRRKKQGLEDRLAVVDNESTRIKRQLREMTSK